MGRITTPTYRIEFEGVIVLTGTEARRVRLTPQGWDAKRAGSPNDDHLASEIRGIEDATLPGGGNAHLGVTRISRAKVVRQATGDVVASYAPAPFQVQA